MVNFCFLWNNQSPWLMFKKWDNKVHSVLVFHLQCRWAVANTSIWHCALNFLFINVFFSSFSSSCIAINLTLNQQDSKLEYWNISDLSISSRSHISVLPFVPNSSRWSQFISLPSSFVRTKQRNKNLKFIGDLCNPGKSIRKLF